MHKDGDCLRFLDQMTAGGSPNAELAAHAAGCPACAQRLHLASALRKAPPPPLPVAPAALQQRIVASLEKEFGGPGAGAPPPGPGLAPLPLLAVAVVIALGAGMLLWPRGSVGPGTPARPSSPPPISAAPTPSLGTVPAPGGVVTTPNPHPVASAAATRHPHDPAHPTPAAAGTGPTQGGAGANDTPFGN